MKKRMRWVKQRRQLLPPLPRHARHPALLFFLFISTTARQSDLAALSSSSLMMNSERVINAAPRPRPPPHSKSTCVIFENASFILGPEIAGGRHLVTRDAHQQTTTTKGPVKVDPTISAPHFISLGQQQLPGCAVLCPVDLFLCFKLGPSEQHTLTENDEGRTDGQWPRRAILASCPASAWSCPKWNSRA